MKTASWILAVILSLMSVGVARSDDSPKDRVTVPIVTDGDQEVLVLVIKGVVDGDRPRVKVRGGKVLLRDGRLMSWQNPRTEDRKTLYRLMRNQSLVFRLYHGEEGAGIYSYRVMAKDERPDGGGNWLEALPLDRDATFQELTRAPREEADLMNLLQLDLDEVDQAIEREEGLDRKIAEAVQREWDVLHEGKAFFIPTRRR